jgi:hypothetical protein
MRAPLPPTPPRRTTMRWFLKSTCPALPACYFTRREPAATFLNPARARVVGVAPSIPPPWLRLLPGLQCIRGQSLRSESKADGMGDCPVRHAARHNYLPPPLEWLKGKCFHFLFKGCKGYRGSKSRDPMKSWWCFHSSHCASASIISSHRQVRPLHH